MIRHILALLTIGAAVLTPLASQAQQPPTAASAGASTPPLAPLAPQAPGAAKAAERAPTLPPLVVPNYREALRDVVRTLSQYARSRNPRLLVLTREGLALAVMQERETKLDMLSRKPNDPPPTTPTGSVVRRYVRALDGVILDGQFCGPKVTASTAFLGALKEAGLNILSIDHCGAVQAANDAYAEARKIGVIAQVDVESAPLDRMPPTVWGENSGNVGSLAEAKNFVLLETAANGGSKAAWIETVRASNADVIAVPAFWRDRDALTAAEVAHLKTKKMGARRLVLARMNIAYARDTDYYWKESWKVGDPDWLAMPILSTPGTFRVNYWAKGWQTILGKTFAGLLDLGFDGVVLERVEVYKDLEKDSPVK